MLLPKEATSARLLAPAGIGSRLETIEQSRYLVFELSAPLAQNCQVQIEYERRSNAFRFCRVGRAQRGPTVHHKAIAGS